MCDVCGGCHIGSGTHTGFIAEQSPLDTLHQCNTYTTTQCLLPAEGMADDEFDNGRKFSDIDSYNDQCQSNIDVYKRQALPCLMALTVPDFKSAPDNDCTDLIDRITAMDEEQFAQMQRMSAATLTTDSLRFAEIVNWGLASDRKTYAKLFCDFSNTDLRECIKNIVVPSLVLLEPYFKHIDTVIKNQYKNLSVAQIRYADKGLHFVMFDDREWFIHQICEFIKER